MNKKKQAKFVRKNYLSDYLEHSSLSNYPFEPLKVERTRYLSYLADSVDTDKDNWIETLENLVQAKLEKNGVWSEIEIELESPLNSPPVKKKKKRSDSFDFIVFGIISPIVLVFVITVLIHVLTRVSV